MQELQGAPILRGYVFRPIAVREDNEEVVEQIQCRKGVGHIEVMKCMEQVMTVMGVGEIVG
jgi:hypothetical protein